MISVRHKILPLTKLARIAATARKEKKSVVLCHGVFDLVHMGHVRHLEAARREGDVLIVSVTADAFVNKGPGRPVFPEALRAEMLSAMQYVDYVMVNDAPTAVNIINALQPNIYVKGSDYRNATDDVTGNIDNERNAVESHGGRIVFTGDIVFSSSSLINQHLSVYDRPLQEYLDRARTEEFYPQILALIEKISDFKVLFVGDAIIDEYQYVTAMGKSAKENIIATRFQERELFAGGVFAAANHVASFCKQVEILTCLGADDSHEEFIRSHLKNNVTLTPIHRAGAPTTRKCRFIESAYVRKLFEVYFFDDAPLNPPLEDALVNLIREKAKDFDLVIATDFGHGLLTRRAIDALTEEARFLAVNTQTNAANHGYNLVTRYKKANYVCIDAPEAHLAVGDRLMSVEDIVSTRLPTMMQCDRFVVTHGKRGCVAQAPGDGPWHIPAFTNEVVDTVGAGDAFLAVTAPLAAAGGHIEHVAFVGNAAGAMKVRIVGHRSSVEKASLLKYITALLK